MYSSQSPLIGQNPFENNAMAIKKFFSKPIVLIFAITFTLNAILGIYSGYKTSNTYSKYAGSLGYTMPDSITNSTSLAWLIVTAIFYGLVCFALFYIYMRSKNPDPSVLPNAGFTILQVYSVILIVLFSIIVALLVFVGVVMGIAGVGGFESYLDIIQSEIPQYGEFADLTADMLLSVMVFVIFVIATVMAIALTYAIALFRFLSSAKYNTKNLTMKVKGSTYVGVMSIIMAVFMGFSLISVIGASSFTNVAGAAGYPDDALVSQPLTIISSILSMAQIIMLAIITLSYKGHIRRTAIAVPVGFIPSVPVMPVAPVMPAYNTNPYASASFNNMPGAPTNPTAPSVPMQSAPAAPVAPVSQVPFTAPTAQNVPVAEPKPATEPQPEPITEPEEPKTPSIDEAWPVDKTCPNCGTVVPSSTMFCSECGTKLN